MTPVAGELSNRPGVAMLATFAALPEPDIHSRPAERSPIGLQRRLRVAEQADMRDHKIGRSIMRRRSGFTLIEVLAVVVILGILAAVVVPQISSAAEDARPISMSATVRSIRQQIEYHTSVGDVPLSAGGYPDTIDPVWFMLGQLPRHTWTDLPLILKVETKGADEVYPKKKTFDLKKAELMIDCEPRCDAITRSSGYLHLTRS